MRVSEASVDRFGRIGSNMREGVLEQKFLLQGKAWLSEQLPD